ncbi:hypothetical protein [Qipengyuania sp. MTN3-11]|uniref:hypothetical protein n=1 Tax=Qipengyuania sp. MTN3-11 TaxID=3056557 RepID=UPI0036F26601
MPRTRVTVRIHDDPDLVPIEFETHDVATALTVADINTMHGRADISAGGRIVARLAKRGKARASFWEVF